MKKENVLNDCFNELIYAGYIYDEDEDGLNMSYSEILEVSNILEMALIEEVTACEDIEEAAETLKNIIFNTFDDVALFLDLNEYGAFEFYYNEEQETYELYNIPEKLESYFFNILDGYDFKNYNYTAA